MLWLCLYFRHLPMESFSGVRCSDRPLIISEAGRIIQCNPQARRCGVQPGMTPAAARAIADGLLHQHRSPQQEQQVLEQLALWAGQFTSQVSLTPPLSLLLEIEGSLRYFHGLEALRRRIDQGLKQLDYTADTGIAPTPTAAWMMARSGNTTPITQRHHIEQALAPLPVSALALERKEAEALQGLGCQCIGDIRALPLAGALRRLGKPLIHTLQKAYGERPDPRSSFVPPARFRHLLSFIEPVGNVAQLRPALQRLIDILCDQLRRRDAGIMRLRFTLTHRRGQPSLLTVGMLQPDRDPVHLHGLLERQLETLSLTREVTAVTLNAGRFYALQSSTQTLDLAGDPTEPKTAEDWIPLIETLDNRLGQQCVHILGLKDEHRPERAWQYRRPGENTDQDHASTNRALPARPFWLLPEPKRLTSQQGRPLYQGPLVLEHGPERIESGWWDGHDVSRDYYRARNPQGQHLWVFRERRGNQGWYLHGIFA